MLCAVALWTFSYGVKRPPLSHVVRRGFYFIQSCCPDSYVHCVTCKSSSMCVTFWYVHSLHNIKASKVLKLLYTLFQHFGHLNYFTFKVIQISKILN